MSKVPKLYKLSLNKLIKEYFQTNDYNMVNNIYPKISELNQYALPIDEWDSLYSEMFVETDDDLIDFIENKMDNKEFSKNEILRKADKKFIEASYKYISHHK